MVKGSVMTVNTRVLKLMLMLVFGWSLQAHAAVVEEDPNLGPDAAPGRSGVFLEFLNYEDYIYSQSKKTEVGDATKIDLGLRYQHSPDTFARFRFVTDPVANRFNNKTSKFEILAGHKRGPWYFQLDTEVLTNDGASGGTSIGMDLDSELTSISYGGETFDFTFYPFNFDGEVGAEFNTWDVTRIHFIEGAPTTVNPTQLGNERLLEKTIPGFELAWRFLENKNARFYVGLGAASFLYPINSTFNIETSPTADRWERRENIGYKAGFTYQIPDLFRMKLQGVGHTDSLHTGSLLAKAASVYGIGRIGSAILENEWTLSKAGEAPYRVSRSGEWFEDVTPFQPIYSDIFGQHQNWIGQTDYATSFRLGYEQNDSTTPYLTYKYQGSNFIFRDRESAHRLRTGDESESHGGLHRAGFGVFFYSGNFVVNPEFEFFHAKNAVFANASDVRTDRRLASFSKEDYQLSLLITYRVDGFLSFRP